LEADAITTIIKLRLLILRAAQKDSLHWWEDESLTQSGGFLAERVFVMDTPETVRKLALEAGKTRYRMALGEDRKRLHLFWLDRMGQTEHDVLWLRLLNYEMPTEPITSMDMFREKLLEITGAPMPYERAYNTTIETMEIRIKGFPGKVSVVNLAKTLAWACLESSHGKPVFPYVQLTL